MYDPEGGEGAIVGGCKRCMQLLDIRESHRRTLDLIKAFGPTREGKPVRALVLEDRQMSLFPPRFYSNP